MTAASSDFNPLQRFSDRVADYVRYRPAYPAELMRFLEQRTGLSAVSVVADIGSGTGIFTRLLVELGAKVFAVEPNDAMRAAAEEEFRSRPHFVSVKGTAEATGLERQCVSLITCAQAFHWFEPFGTRREFRRILVPNGWCALIWNTAVIGTSEFALGYEQIKSEFGTDFHRIRHENLEAENRFDPFFGPGAWEKHSFPNYQALDLPGLTGRLLSSSYAPKVDDPRHQPMLAALRSLFERCQQGGQVRMDYSTDLFLGHLK